MPVICPACGAPQDLPDSIDHFQLFGLPRRFNISLADLQSRFLDLTRRAHPDRFASASEETRLRATRLSAAINEAMAALKSPLRRAEYLLELHGGRNSDEERRVPQEVLGEVLMLREEIEDARAADDQTTLARIRDQLRTRHRQTTDEMARLADLSDLADPSARTGLREVINTAKYYEKTLDELARL